VDALPFALGGLLRASWQASVLVGLVIVAQGLLGKRLPARWRFALWWLVLARLVLPVGPATPFSLFNYPRLQVPATAPFQVAGPTSGFLATLPWIWLAGVVFMVGRILWESQRLAYAVVRQRPVTDSAVLDLLEDCKAAMKLHTPVVVVETPHVSYPALHGFLRPRLLLPRGLLQALSPEELRYVFFHELGHLDRHDIATGWLMAALQAVHWFNPMVWFAFHRMRADRELAADEAALWHSKPRENHAYGETILKLLEGFAQPVPLPAMVGILEDQNQLRRRIRHIAQFGQVRQWPAISFLVFLVLALVCLTDGKRDASRSVLPGHRQVESAH
jgi:bla regulator protein BlaR1